MLHIGATAWDVGPPGTAEQFARQAERAEAFGFDSFWLPEFHFDEAVPLPQPLLPLAAMAARTRRLRLGTGSYLLPIRHPVQAAEEIAVLDRLSAGRVILGIGRGYRRGLFDAFDVPGGEKRSRFERTLATMIDAWTGRPVAWEPDESRPARKRMAEGNEDARRAGGGAPTGGGGRDVPASGRPLHLVPRPVQKPHPPIWIAAFGPKALGQAGRLGLPYFASPIESMDALARNFATYREASERVGRGAPIEVPIMRTVFVSRSRERLHEARRRLEEQAASLSRSPVEAIRRGAGVRPDDWALVGEPEAVDERIEQYRERFGMSHLVASRTRLPGLDPSDFERSLELLAGVCRSLD